MDRFITEAFFYKNKEIVFHISGNQFYEVVENEIGKKVVGEALFLSPRQIEAGKKYMRSIGVRYQTFSDERAELFDMANDLLDLIQKKLEKNIQDEENYKFNKK